jgi:glutamate mutase epsilon subunit
MQTVNNEWMTTYPEDEQRMFAWGVVSGANGVQVVDEENHDGTVHKQHHKGPSDCE